MRTSRACAFGAAAAAYAAHRPGYPPAAVAWALAPVSDRAGPALLDLGAGTGKLTGSLLGSGPVTAIEPDDAMLGELRTRFPEVDARAGCAEAIPMPDASVDAVLVAQAWHWFEPDRAMAEIGRVLRPGGVLAALWNVDDAGTEWVAGYHEAAASHRPVPGLPPEHVVPTFPPRPAFGPSAHTIVPNPVRTTTDGLIATLATHSWALLSEPADRDAALGRVRAYLATRPETSAGAFVLPLETAVLRALRR